MTSSRYISLLTASAVILTFAGCNRITDGNSDSSSSSGMEVSSAMMMESSSSSSVSSDEASSAMKTSSAQAQVRVITITAKNWAFSPATINVKKGEKVQLKIVGTEGIHGFAIADLNLNVTIKAGETVTVDLPTDTAGTFSFRCSVPCGDGHKEMVGMLVVT